MKRKDEKSVKMKEEEEEELELIYVCMIQHYNIVDNNINNVMEKDLTLAIKEKLNNLYMVKV